MMLFWRESHAKLIVRMSVVKVKPCLLSSRSYLFFVSLFLLCFFYLKYYFNVSAQKH